MQGAGITAIGGSVHVLDLGQPGGPASDEVPCLTESFPHLPTEPLSYLLSPRARPMIGLREDGSMLTLYSYPSLFGVADNNGYGLKVFAFLKLAKVPFVHEHIFDASAAPRGQLPYITDDGEAVGDSDTIIAWVARKYRVTMDDGLSTAQRDTSHLVTRMLDDLYWVMSYSRWKDERFCPSFIAAFRREHPSVTEEGLLKAKEFNAQRYHYQGIGRYSPDAAYARGLADLEVLANLVPDRGYLHGPKPTSIDAGVYGFIANIFYYDIDTPLKQFVAAHHSLVRHCETIHAAVAAP
jgi:glutathione S-transferase